MNLQQKRINLVVNDVANKLTLNLPQVKNLDSKYGVSIHSQILVHDFIK